MASLTLEQKKLIIELKKHEKTHVQNEIDKWFPIAEHRTDDYHEFKKCYLQTIETINLQENAKKSNKSKSGKVSSLLEESNENMLRAEFIDSLEFVKKDAKLFSIVKFKPPHGRSSKSLDQMNDEDKYWYNVEESNNNKKKKNKNKNKNKKKCKPYNPFTAFIYETCSLKEKAIDRIGHPIGNLYEYMVAKHIKKSTHIKCINCKPTNRSIIWNGGSSTSWQDLICTNCGAFYEIKAKKTWYENFMPREKAINRCLARDVNGGSYSRFKEQKGEKINHFLVIVDRGKLTQNKHQVYCYKILDVFPRLNEKTFAKWKRDGKNEDYQMTLKSNIKVDLDSEQKWFKLPKSEYTDPEKKLDEIKATFLQEWLNAKFDAENNNEASDTEVLGKKIENLNVKDSWEEDCD